MFNEYAYSGIKVEMAGEFEKPGESFFTLKKVWITGKHILINLIIMALPGFVWVSHFVTDLLPEGLPVIPPLCQGFHSEEE